MVYLRRDGTVFRAAEDVDAFAQLLRAGVDWRAPLVPEPDVQGYTSRGEGARGWVFLGREKSPP